ncbi:MAG: MFS transporter [Propionibacteriaceae bacterium]|uniref:Gph: sugar (Glycoside-Pentoside-Hexuronide) transporter n=1 Tax=Propionibacterium ruminifibrarum TaxID=1962131 RepID=A0A375I2Z6_9ACTN|nr:glycoside-pentoside-hexuronide (GPH):cation symporter [Propionibacterium ruminifibrarum]MBE6478470.1 MFS transporter [Propionibacteriaceae bacterium]SPF68508.1 gph: sugar (Glycoside-Pentoside-Hexuronide) transporter [Propionibacterium ruminifibrarum]
MSSVVQTGPTRVRPFGWRDKIGYAFGDFGNDLTFVLSAMFLMKFYTDVMGVSAALVGTMMMACRIVDAFTDVTMGQIIDRSRPTAKGKFAPWLRRMCAPVAVASVLCFAVWFQDMPMGFKIFWMFFSYLLWGSVCYTSINIPYGSMASAISDNPDDRTALSTWRGIGATIGQVVIGVALPLFVYYRNEAGDSILDGTKMMWASVFCSVLAVGCYLICYQMSTERVKLEKTTQKFSLTYLLKYLFTNRALIGIVVCALLLLVGQLSLGNMGNYIYPNYFNSPSMLSYITFIGAAITLVLSVFTPALARRFGKKEISMVTIAISAVALFAAFFAHTHDVRVWIAFYVFAWLGVASFSLICWAMIIDVIDDTEVRFGDRQDGTVYATYSWARKLGQAGSAGLTGILLSVVGYKAETGFTPEVTDGIYNITCLVPGVSFALLFFALWFLYPLNKKRVDANAAQLAAQREAKA